MSYTFSLENLERNYPEMEHLYRMHYGEMRDRLASDGAPIGEYKPRLDQYFTANNHGWLLHYVVRCDGEIIGYANVYLTQDMHNKERIAQEDTLYVHPDHRNGVGRKLVKYILDDLRKRKVVRVTITPVTDLRVGRIWKRMGFQEVATQMVYHFGD